MPPNARPRTSQPRGICRYYTAPRGCFAGSTCKFLHGAPEQLDPQNPLLTPYDESKHCVFYSQGFCRRGDQCWFKHSSGSSDSSRRAISRTEEDLQNEPCSICFETPTTYGLLSGCSHIFCIICIRQWRDQKGQTEHGNIKKCPICREPSRFITPSSRFWKHGHPEKDRVTESYKDSTAKIPCRYFRQSLQRDKTRPLCPFGKDCFYQHLNADGTPHVFTNGPETCMRQYYVAMRPSMHTFFDDFIDLASEFLPTPSNGQRLPDGANIFSLQVTADMDTIDVPGAPTSPTRDGRARMPTLREDPQIRRQLRIIRNAMDSLESASNNSLTRTLDMVRMLVRRDTDADLDPDFMAESVSGQTPSGEDQTATNRSPRSPGISMSPQSITDDLEMLGDDYYNIPGLGSISSSSPSDTYLSDSDSDSDDDVSRLGRYLRNAAGASSLNQMDVPAGEDGETRMMRGIAERGPEAVEEDPTQVSQIDEPPMPVMECELPTVEEEVDLCRVTTPPFLTDGRGKVVWSSDREDREGVNGEASSSTEINVAAVTAAGELEAKRDD